MKRNWQRLSEPDNPISLRDLIYISAGPLRFCCERPAATEVQPRLQLWLWGKLTMDKSCQIALVEGMYVNWTFHRLDAVEEAGSVRCWHRQFGWGGWQGWEGLTKWIGNIPARWFWAGFHWMGKGWLHAMLCTCKSDSALLKSYLQ